VLVASVLAGALFAAGRLFEPQALGNVRAAVRDYLGERKVRHHADVLKQAARESGIDPYLLAGVMLAESSGRVSAKSAKGALGLFQLMPITARWRAEKLGLPAPTEEELLSDPLLNARLGADNLAWLLDTYDGDVERALVAYNLGTGRLAKMVREAGGWEAWRAERERAGDSALLAYAARVERYRRRLEAAGVLGPSLEPEGTQPAIELIGDPAGGERASSSPID